MKERTPSDAASRSPGPGKPDHSAEAQAPLGRSRVMLRAPRPTAASRLRRRSRTLCGVSSRLTPRRAPAPASSDAVRRSRAKTPTPCAASRCSGRSADRWTTPACSASADDLGAVVRAVGGDVGDQARGADRGQERGEIGERRRLAPAQRDLKHAPGRQPFDDPAADFGAGPGLAPGAALGVAEGATEVAAISHRPVRDDRGAQARIGLGRRVLAPGIGGQVGRIAGRATDDAPGLQARTNAASSGRRAGWPWTQEPPQVGERLRLGQCGDRVEALGVQLDKVALVAVKGEPSPRLAPETDGRVSLEPAAEFEAVAHTRSSWPTIFCAARERRGVSPLGPGPRRGWRRCGQGVAELGLRPRLAEGDPARLALLLQLALAQGVERGGRRGRRGVHSSASSSSVHRLAVERDNRFEERGIAADQLGTNLDQQVDKSFQGVVVVAGELHAVPLEMAVDDHDQPLAIILHLDPLVVVAAGVGEWGQESLPSAGSWAGRS